MIPLLMAALFLGENAPAPAKVKTGLPEVVIADELRKPPEDPADGFRDFVADPNEIKITLINRTKGPIRIVLGPHIHKNWFTVRFFNERGRPLTLLPTSHPFAFEGADTVLFKTEPGETSAYYFSPRSDYVIPPGRYRLEVVYYYYPPGSEYPKEVVSNRITKTFP